jgi:hypothetical protein
MQYSNASQGKPDTEPNYYVRFKLEELWAIIYSALEEASVFSDITEATRESNNVRELHINITKLSF